MADLGLVFLFCSFVFRGGGGLLFPAKSGGGEQLLWWWWWSAFCVVLVCSISDVNSVPTTLFLRLSSCGLFVVRCCGGSVFCSVLGFSPCLGFVGRRHRMVVVVISVG